MQPSELQQAYQEATRNNGLVELMATLREPKKKYKTKKDDIYSIFKNSPLWDEEETKNGHVKFKHRITQIVIGYQNHGGPTMDAGGVDTLTKLLQDHLNILANNIFQFTANHWKQQPDWPASERNLATWRIQRKNQ